MAINNCSFSLPAPIVALAAALVLLLISSGAGVTATGITRPTTLTFAYHHNNQDAFFQDDLVQLYVGLKAAEHRINSMNLLRGTNVSIVHYAAPSFFSGDAALVAAQVVADGVAMNANASVSGNMFMGFVLSDWVTSAYLYAVNPGVFPIVAGRSFSDSEYGSSAYAYVTPYRFPIRRQYLAMLHHAINDETAQCGSFVLITRQFLFPNAISDVREALAHLGYSAPLLEKDLGADPTSLNVTDAIEAWLGSGVAGVAESYPMCGLFMALAPDTQTVLSGMYGDGRFPYSKMTFYATDFVLPSTMNSSVHGTAPYRRLFIPSDFGDPQSTTVPLARSYRAALQAYLATSPVLPATIASVGIAMEAAPNTASYEGYVAGMMLGYAMRHMPSLTPSDWMADLYELGTVWMEDTAVGPFANHCLNNSDSSVTLPCFCNIGAPNVKILTVDATSGKYVKPAFDSVTKPFLTFDQASTANCIPSASDLTLPVHFDLFGPAGGLSAAGQTLYQYFFAYLRGSAAQINSAGTLREMTVSVSFMSEVMEAQPASDSASTVLRRLYERRQPYLVLGDWWNASDVTVPVFNLYASGVTQQEDVAVATPTEYTRNTWYFTPTQGDLTHAAAKMVVAKLGVSADVTIVADTDALLSKSLRSLNTFQVAVRSSVLMGNLTDVSGVASLIVSKLTEAAEGTGSVVLFVNTLSGDAGTAVVLAAAAAVGTFVATPAASSSAAYRVGAFSRFSMVIVTDANNLYVAKMAMSNATRALLLNFPVYFPSYLMPFFEPTNAARLAFISTTNLTAEALVEAPVFYIGAIVVSLLTTSLSAFSARPSVADLMTYIYTLGSINAAGVTIGPFHANNCSAAEVAANRADRTCQCFKAMRTMRVYDLRGWLANDASYNPNFQWAMDTCGVVYEPLRVATSLNVGMVVGIAVPCGGVVVAGLLYVALCCGRRNNRTAPKDATVPFAMVFTDIQSSTSLWARAPEAMGPALEQHHELLRGLVRQHDGYEVKTIGDSFMVAFKRASDAAAFGLAIQTTLYDASWPADIDDVYVSLAQEQWQQAMENEVMEAAGGSKSDSSSEHAAGASAQAASTSPVPGAKAGGAAGNARAVQQWEDEATYIANWNGIRVRVGLHWGMGSVKLDPVSQGYDYYGTLVNTAARVEGVGNGGQVLATKDMFDQLEAEGFGLGGVDVVPLGPQPLRGLDAPVPLYQLSPERLRTRQFAALRLDVEIDPDETTTSDQATSGDAGTRLSAGSELTPEQYLDRLLHKTRDGAALREYLLRVSGFVLTALRTSTPQWRKETLKHLLKKWHLKPRVPADSRESSEKTAHYDVMSLVVRVGLAAEEAEHARRGFRGVECLSTASSNRQRRVSFRVGFGAGVSVGGSVLSVSQRMSGTWE